MIPYKIHAYSILLELSLIPSPLSLSVHSNYSAHSSNSNCPQPWAMPPNFKSSSSNSTPIYSSSNSWQGSRRRVPPSPHPLPTSSTLRILLGVTWLQVSRDCLVIFILREVWRRRRSESLEKRKKKEMLRKRVGYFSEERWQYQERLRDKNNVGEREGSRVGQGRGGDLRGRYENEMRNVIALHFSL